jgi:NADPH:quinone reductase-like Zn-dependent oxidoreductase
MKALRLIEERNLQILDVPEPPPPGPGEVRLRMRAVALNHIDVWGYRGMAFAQRTLPITVGAESVGEIETVGAGVALKPGTKVVPYGGRTCGTCRRCAAGRDNLCENIAGIMGFHIDGMAQQWVNIPARLVVPVPDNVSVTHAACAGITYSTVEHMLTDNAKLQPGETILIHAAGSGIGSTAILYAKDLGCEIFTTASTDAKLERAKALGAHHLINYKEQRFETLVRRKTNSAGSMSSSSISVPIPGPAAFWRSRVAVGSSPAVRPVVFRQRPISIRSISSSSIFSALSARPSAALPTVLPRWRAGFCP